VIFTRPYCRPTFGEGGRCVALFDTPAVKELKRHAQLIGSMHGQVYLGHLPQRDLEDVVHDQEMRLRLRRAYDAAVADVGEKKALKAAVSETRIWAEASGRLRQANYGDMVLAAERSLRSMLGEPAADVPHRGQNSHGAPPSVEQTSRRYLASAPPGPRTELLAAAAVFRALPFPCADIDRLGTIVDRQELHMATEEVRSLMVQDRDLAAQLARKVLLQLNALLRGDGPNQDMVEGDRSGHMTLYALKEVGLRAVVPADGGDVTLEVSAMPAPAEADAAVATRIARQAIAVLFSVLGHGSPRERQFYVGLHTGRGDIDVETVAYQIAAWGVILTARLVNACVIAGFRPEYARVVPLAAPGWYPNPFNTGPIVDGDASIQRFWDTQWTDRVRVRKSGRWVGQTHSLHDPPPD